MTIHISRSKGNQTMKFGQLIKDNKRNIFLQTLFRKRAKILIPDLSLFFKKTEVKPGDLEHSFNIV